MKTALRKAMSLLLAVMMIFGTAALGITDVAYAECEEESSKDVWEDEEVPTLNPGNPDRPSEEETDPVIPDDVATSGICGENLIWSFDESTGTLSVSGTGAMKNYDKDLLKAPWHNYSYYVKTVIISDGVTSIGDYAFYLCRELSNISIPDKVTSIGAGAFMDCDSITSITIPDTVTSISDYTFYRCHSLTSVVMGKNVKSIGESAFFWCEKLESISLPESLTNIGVGAFEWCDGIKNITIPSGIKTINKNTFCHCDNLLSVTIPYSVTSICSGAFIFTYIKDVHFTGSKKQWNAISIEDGNDPLNSATVHYGIHNVNWVVDGKQTSQEVKVGAKITPPANPTKSGYTFKGWSPAVPATMPEKDMTFTAVFEKAVYNVIWVVDGAKTTHKYEVGAKITAPANPTKSGYTFKGWSPAVPATMPGKDMTFTAVFEKIPEKNIYNLGEETYSFYNFGDTDSKGGHCFGMSVTSSAYYTGELDVTEIGVASSDKLYTLSKSSKVKEPICYYQNIQGSRRNKAIVAGARRFKNAHVDINADWTEVLNYVKNHEHDNKGTLQVINYVNSEGGHAMNFLYYSNVNGQDRVYVYDNNFPDVETYFYKDSLGKIRQAPKSTFKGALDSIGIVDVKKYLQNAGDFDFTQVIYANEGEVSISGAEAYVMLETSDGKEKYMYELPENASEVTIIPLVDNAEFTYIDEEYSFGTVSDDTVGLFTLASDDVHGAQNVGLKVVNVGFDIRTPSTTSITYGDSIVLHADVENLPEGAKIVWTADNSNFTYTASADGTTCTVSPSANGNTVFTAAVVDENGNEISSDTQTMTSKAGFFQKIIAFFKKLFGLTKIIPEAFKY